MKTKQTFLIMAISLMALTAGAQLQYITNISVAQRTDLSGLLDVHFDLVAMPADDYIISFSVSFDTGNTFNYVPREFLTGDIGPISPGTDYHIVWNGLHSFPETYGPQSQLKIYAVSCPEFLVDIDGNEYQTVPVGGQCWMKENLKTTKYSNGTNIEYPGTDIPAWQTNTTGAYAWYENDISWKDSYGALYNWHAVSNLNGLCPLGWHLPSVADWTQLIDYTSEQGFPNTVAGNALKSCRQINSPLEGECNTTEHPRWHSDETNYGTDIFGFSGLPGGYRTNIGGYANIGIFSNNWSTTEFGFWHAIGTTQSYGHSGFNYNSYNPKSYGFSVRCLRD